MQQRQRFAPGLEARAVGDQAVKQTQQQQEAVVGLLHPVLEAQRQGMRQGAQPFELAADTEQAPAVVADHAVGLRAGDRRQVRGGARQRLQHVAGLCAHGIEGTQGMQIEVLADIVDQLPMFGRQAIAQRLRALAQVVHAVQAVASARLIRVGMQTMQQGALEHPG